MRLALFVLSAALAAAQGLTSKQIHQPLAGNGWPTYSGDYSAKRYSTLTQLNQSNVKNLTLAWLSRLPGGTNIPGLSTTIGGEGPGEFAGVNIKGSILQVDGVLYVSAPDNAWAMDARDGRVM